MKLKSLLFTICLLSACSASETALDKSKQAVDLYSQGEYAFKHKDYAKAKTNFEITCEQGNASACTMLGVLYHHGYGVEQNHTKAAEFYKKAADFFQKGCEGDKTEGCRDLGAAYYHGEGVAKDETKAAQIWQKACDNGEMNSCAAIAVFYDKVAQDKAKAVQLYEKACDGGISEACYDLGVFYHLGDGVAKDEAKAEALHQKAKELMKKKANEKKDSEKDKKD